MLNNAARGRLVLFTWEAGANLGHMMPLVQVARRVTEAGATCLFAVCDLNMANLVLKGSGIQFVQAPVWPWHDHAGNEDGHSGYQDVLAELGFGDSSKLIAMLQGWSTLLDLIAPDLIVADHSPALCALASARNNRVIAVGNGFTLPPIEYASFPPIRADRAPLVPEEQLLKSLANALAELNLDSPQSLVGGLATTERIVCSFPELDYYQGWRGEALYLPLEPLPAVEEPPDEPCLFVYVGDEFPEVSMLAQVLGDFSCPVECYLRDAPRTLISFLRLRGVTVHEAPPDLSQLLPRVSHVLSQGGNGLSHMAMAAGRPHIIMPIHGENEMNLARLSAMGIGKRLAFFTEAKELQEELESFMQNHTLIIQAMQWGAKIALCPQPAGDIALMRLITDCLEISPAH